MSGSGISWAMCKSAPRFRNHALPATQTTASKHWRHTHAVFVQPALFSTVIPGRSGRVLKLKFGGSRVYLARQSTAFHNPSPNQTHMCSFCSTSPFLHSYTGQVKPGPRLLKFGDTQKTSVTGYLTGDHSIKSPDPVYQTWNRRQCQGHQWLSSQFLLQLWQSP